MKLHLIFARARNGVIGRQGGMPWHLPEDMAHLRAKTVGCPVIMGRKTWDSLPPQFRPLPGRDNLVITRQTGWTAEGATVMPSLGQALAHCHASSEVWVIGGAQIYALAEPLAHRAEVTEIAQDFEGDAFAPSLGAAWRESGREDRVSAKGLAFSFVTYRQQPTNDQ